MTEKDDTLGEKALSVVSEAREIIIKTNDDLNRAIQLWDVLDGLKKSIKDKYDDIIEHNRAAWKYALAKKAKYYNPVDEQAKLLKLSIGEYKKQKELARKAEEDKLYEEAVKQEETRRLLEAEANPREADEILSEPIVVAPVVLPKDIPSGGPVLRTIWDAEVFDLDELIKACADGRVSSLALIPESTFLRKQAQSFKDKLNIPGVRAYSRMV